MRRRLTIACLLASATPVDAAEKPKPAPAPRPYAGVYQPQGVDEIGMWREDDESERALANSPMLLRDEALTGYVKKVLCSAVGEDRCAATRVYIVRSPVFNASMTPNGTMRVFTGLLLRVTNEAELASVLGHEFGHFEQRHSLQSFKARRTGSDLLSWGAILASMSTTPYARSNFDTLRLSTYGNLYRFERDHEREADLLGLGYLNSSKLRPQAAAEIWRKNMAEAEASARGRGLKKPRFNQIAFFASHPPDAERADYLAALALADGGARDDGAARYVTALAKWMPVFLDDQIKLNDFGGSEHLITMLAQRGWTAPLWHARGELFRTRGAQRDLVHAAGFYANAIGLDPSLAEAHRGLGLSLTKTGRAAEARASLQRYLELRPDASDGPMVRMILSSTGAD